MWSQLCRKVQGLLRGFHSIRWWAVELVPREPREREVSLCRSLFLVLGAGVIQDDLLHRAWASCPCPRKDLPRQSRLEYLLVGCCWRVAMAVWHLVVVGPSGAVVLTVPWGLWGRMGRQQLGVHWIPLKFKLRWQFPGPQRPREVLQVTRGGEGQWPLQLPDAQDILGLGIIACVYRGHIWGCPVPVGPRPGPGPGHHLLATTEGVCQSIR